MTFEQKEPTNYLLPSVDAKCLIYTGVVTAQPGPEYPPDKPLSPDAYGSPSNSHIAYILPPFPDDFQNNNTANDQNDLPSSTNLSSSIPIDSQSIATSPGY